MSGVTRRAPLNCDPLISITVGLAVWELTVHAAGVAIWSRILLRYLVCALMPFDKLRTQRDLPISTYWHTRAVCWLLRLARTLCARVRRHVRAAQVPISRGPGVGTNRYDHKAPQLSEYLTHYHARAALLPITHVHTSAFTGLTCAACGNLPCSLRRHQREPGRHTVYRARHHGPRRCSQG